jgi:hypothetical protein
MRLDYAAVAPEVTKALGKVSVAIGFHQGPEPRKKA